jgi:hypothetical protein
MSHDELDRVAEEDGDTIAFPGAEVPLAVGGLDPGTCL